MYPPPHPVPPPEFERLQVLDIDRDLAKAFFTIRYIRNTFAPINKLPPELLASITTSVEDPFGGTVDSPDLPFFCTSVCRYWRNSLLASSAIWSSVDTTNSRHLKLHLTRSKKAPLHVKYGWLTPPGVFEQHIIPECHRLQSLSIPLGYQSIWAVSKSLVEPSESLMMLDMWMAHDMFPVPADILKAISRFAPNITVLRLHGVTANVSSFQFPALVKLTLRVPECCYGGPSPADLVNFLKHSPVLEELDLRLPDYSSDGVSPSAGTVELVHLKSAVFNGYFSRNSAHVIGLPYLILPKRSITVDVQATDCARPSDPLPLFSVIPLGDTLFPRQSITAAVIHIRSSPIGFFGHASICGEHDNWIGLNYVQTPDPTNGILQRMRSCFDPVNLTPLRGIQTLTLGFCEFASDEEQCIEVLRTFLRGLDRVRILKVYMMNVSVLAHILYPSDGVVPLPSLEELELHTHNPPELNRCVALDEGKRNAIMLQGRF